MATVCFGAFMGQLDASITTLAFPAMQRAFQLPLADVQWVSLAYLIALVSLLPAAGRIADSAGRKGMYLLGFAIFAAASVACGFAPNLGLLIFFRVIQGIGAALLQSNSVALVVTSVAREKMRTALGVQSAAQALGLAVGPVVGGLLVDALDWRWIFWIKFPIGVIGLIAGWFLLPRTTERTPLQHFDFGGLTFLLASAAAVLFGLSGLSGVQVPAGLSVILIVVGIGLAIAFVHWENAVTDPLVRPRLWRSRPVSVGLVGALCGYLVLFGPLTLLPQVFESPGRIGLVLTSLPLGFGLAAVIATKVLPSAFGSRARAFSGAGLAALATGLLAIPELSAGSDGFLLAAGLFASGVGLGVFIPANNTTIMSSIPPRLAATGGGLVNVARSLGTALGVAVVTLCLHAGGGSGARLALVCLTLVGLVGTASAALTGPDRSASGRSRGDLPTAAGK